MFDSTNIKLLCWVLALVLFWLGAVEPGFVELVELLAFELVDVVLLGSLGAPFGIALNLPKLDN